MPSQSSHPDAVVAVIANTWVSIVAAVPVYLPIPVVHHPRKNDTMFDDIPSSVALFLAVLGLFLLQRIGLQHLDAIRSRSSIFESRDSHDVVHEIVGRSVSHASSNVIRRKLRHNK